MLRRALAPRSPPSWALASSRAQTLCCVLAASAQVRVRPWPAAAAPCVPRPLPRAAAAAPSAARSVVFSLGPLSGPRRARPCLACPPLCRSARVRAFALRGRSLPPSAFGPALAALRPSCSVGLAALVLGPCAARRARGAASAPLRGFGGGGSSPCPPLRGLRPRFFFAGGGLLAARAGLPALAALRRVRGACRCVLPCLPPAPAAPAGGLRGAQGPLGAFAPALARVFRVPFAGPPAGCARPCAASAPR